MAKKLKISPSRQHPGLFDLTGDLFAERDIPDKLSFPAPERIRDFEITGLSGRPEAVADKPYALHELRRNALREVRSLKFISFGSGSSGNSAYISDDNCGILIDAGVDTDTVKAALRRHGLSLDNVKAVCLTHDHGDHVRFVYSLVRKHTHIGVYCTPKVLSGILRRHSISRRINDYHRPIYKEFPFRVGDFEITAFDVSHDGTDNSGFFITNGDFSFAIATDLGCITSRVDYYMRRARFIMLESNYDLRMLRTGPYPMYLKARIEADSGHLDNTVAAQFLASVYRPEVSHIFLCHLSNENNTPAAATEAVSSALIGAGVTSVGDGSGSIASRDCPVQLVALPRSEASPLFLLRLND